MQQLLGSFKTQGLIKILSMVNGPITSTVEYLNFGIFEFQSLHISTAMKLLLEIPLKNIHKDLSTSAHPLCMPINTD